MKINKYLKIIFTLTLTFTIIYTSISSSITEKQLKTASNNMVKSGLIYNDDKSYTEIFKTILKLTNLSEEDALKIINLDYIKEELTNIVNSIYEYNITGDESVKYTNEKIIELVENNIKKVTNDINYNLSEKDKNEAIKYTKENINYISNTIYSTDIGDWNKND
jgi:hypothetical protein